MRVRIRARRVTAGRIKSRYAAVEAFCAANGLRRMRAADATMIGLPDWATYQGNRGVWLVKRGAPHEAGREEG